MGKFAQTVAEIRALPPRRIAAVAISNVLLVALAIGTGMPYVVLTALLGVELVVLNTATAVLYPERGLGKHLGDLAKLVAGMLFVQFFCLVTYGVVAEGGNGRALETGVSGYSASDPSSWALALLYVVGHTAFALREARRQPNPREAWLGTTLKEGATTFLALFLMVFVAAFVGRPIVAALAVMELGVDVDTLLAVLLGATRAFFGLVAETMTPAERAAIAAEPYAD